LKGKLIDPGFKMDKLVCIGCGTTLKIPASYTRPTVKCPRCGTHSTIAADERPVPRPTETPSLPPAADDIEKVAVDTSAADIPSTRGRLFRTRLLTSLLDVKFKQYLTPAIIRFSWLMVLILAGIWLCFLLVIFLASLVPSGSSEATASSQNSRQQPLDLEALLNGNGQLPDIGDLLGGSLSGSASKPTFMQSLVGIGWRVMFVATSLASLLLSLLWCRVFLETIIVIFDINDCLKRIESREDSRM
jgi:predicted RNA-binding Zn-ribbon protein involved in translation (DUF1610 family)